MSFIKYAKEVFDIESKAISGLSELLDDNFTILQFTNNIFLG